MINYKLLIFLTLFFEFFTIFGRFIFHMSSKKNYIYIMKKYKLKYFVHIHHGIVGLLIILLSYYSPQALILTLGLALIFSDAIHHLIVLKTIIGDYEFHIIYQNIGIFEKEQKRDAIKFKKFWGHLVHHS